MGEMAYNADHINIFNIDVSELYLALKASVRDTK
jgi:hypothetical protein